MSPHAKNLFANFPSNRNSWLTFHPLWSQLALAISNRFNISTNGMIHPGNKTFLTIRKCSGNWWHLINFVSVQQIFRNNSKWFFGIIRETTKMNFVIWNTFIVRSEISINLIFHDKGFSRNSYSTFRPTDNLCVLLKVHTCFRSKI